ncbi:ATP-dependent DNA helicase RecG [bacterium]|nr:ATP-dependent DNA helicase RecG [bacterium]
MLTLNSKINEISGIGKTIGLRLQKLGIETIEDLLLYLPWYHESAGDSKLLSNAEIDEKNNLILKIDLIDGRRSFNRKLYITEAFASDSSGEVKITWFNQKWLEKNLKPGDIISVNGKLEKKYGQLTMTSPIYEKISFNPEKIHTSGIIPYYHLTSNITQKQLRTLIRKIIPLAKNINDWLPKETKKNLNILDKGEAIEKIHFPKNEKDLKEAKKRLAFEELFLIQLKSQAIKKQYLNIKAKAIKFNEIETKKFVKNLPFELTNEQKKSAWEILTDLQKNTPMIRLLEGDVGSGKTIVALIAMFNASLNNKNKKNKQQSILMAPTEILAKQHFNTIKELLKDWPINISLYTRSYKENNFLTENIKKENKKKKLNKSKNEEISQTDIVIGTQALIQEKSPFKNPVLVVIDEQHRFGVKQRYELVKNYKKTSPHFLSMTATPIPRTLALSIYGHIKLSQIKHLPPGRQEIITKIVKKEDEEKIYSFIKEKMQNKEQVFVVCPLINPTDKLGVKSVEEEIKNLKKIFPKTTIDKLHGKMKSEEKDRIMEKFVKNKTKILVSTSVIEVGVDIPNATVMIIEGPERFGLAQLHQFRGRIGRGEKQSFCFLKTKNYQNEKTKTRLESLVKYNSGQHLAQIDLKLRGTGEIYGTSQSGFPEIKFASLFDYELIQQAQKEAEKIIKKDLTFLQGLKMFD